MPGTRSFFRSLYLGPNRFLRRYTWVLIALLRAVPGSQSLFKSLYLGPNRFLSHYTWDPIAFEVAALGSQGDNNALYRPAPARNHQYASVWRQCRGKTASIMTVGAINGFTSTTYYCYTPCCHLPERKFETWRVSPQHRSRFSQLNCGT